MMFGQHQMLAQAYRALQSEGPDAFRQYIIPGKPRGETHGGKPGGKPRGENQGGKPGGKTRGENQGGKNTHL